MSRPKLYRPTRPARVIEERLCACGCGQSAPYGFPGNVSYAFAHWPAELGPGGRPPVPPAPAPAPAPRREAGAPVQGDLFGLTNPPGRLTPRPPGLTGRTGS